MWQRRIRGWHVVAGLVVLAAVGVAVGLWTTRTQELDAGSMASYFPDRPAVLAFVDVGAIRSSGLLEKLAGSAAAEAAEYRTFVTNSGFDYKRDLDRVMLNSAGGTHYMLVQGRFDWDKLRSYARAQGGQCEGYDCTFKGSTPDRILSFRKVTSNTMAFASGLQAGAARDVRRRGGFRAAFPIPGEPVWVHAPADALNSFTELPPGMKLFMRALDPAERFVLTLGPEKDAFQVKLDVTCKTAEDAAVMKAQFEGLTALLQGFLKREQQKANLADLSGVLTSGRFDREERHMVGRWTLQRAFLDSLGGS